MRDTGLSYGRFVAGDPLRGIAALGVALLHATGNTAVQTGGFGDRGSATLGTLEAAYGSVFASLMYGGGVGVLVFFVLSGYLIGGRYARQAVGRTASQSVPAYLRNRVLRIVPAYWVVLVAVAVVYGLLLDEARVSLDSVLALAVFDVNADNPLTPWFGQAWTLEVEAKFYVLMAGLALTLLPAIRRIPGGLAVRTAAVVAPCLAWYAYATLLSDLGSSPHSFGYCLSLLLAGTAIGAIEPLARPRVAGLARAGAVGAAMAVAGGAYVLGVAWLGQAVGGVFDPLDGGGLLALAIVAIVAGPVVAQWGTGGCWRALDNRALQWVGRRSYSLYLVHLALQWPIIELLSELGLGHQATLAIVIPVSLAVSLAAADLLYRVVERPFLERKRSGRAVETPSLAKAPA